jgi:mRNA interferase MazF
MAITFHPAPGAILVCNYQTGFREPEMVKTRLCVVITPRLRRRDGLCTVVPLSTTAPNPIEDYHYQVELERDPPNPWGGRVKWAKCDMLATVGYQRLTPIGIGRAPDGTRRYIYPHINGDQLKDIRKAVLCGLTLRDLTHHL